MSNIAIFVSGNGSNAENIINYFTGSATARVTLLVSDNPDAYALRRAARLNVESIVVSRKEIRETDRLAKELSYRNIDFIVLAGFLSLVPASVTAAYPGKILNIHPALLPAYGGKGMYGPKVHEAVIANGETESGITIHYVNERYDEGAIITQYKVAVEESDTAETLATKIHELEYKYFPRVIERVIIDWIAARR